MVPVSPAMKMSLRAEPHTARNRCREGTICLTQSLPVDFNTNPLFHKLLSRFKALTGCPILVNTSFNVRGEPIVCTPEDAFRCFMGNELDMLVVGNCVLQKAEQDPALKNEYRLSLNTD